MREIGDTKRERRREGGGREEEEGGRIVKSGEGREVIISREREIEK